jgi:hypothetical protein
VPAEKGSYRSIYSALWDNPEFQNFDPLTQNVFLFLRTFKDCNFPCIFIFYQSSLYERLPKTQRDVVDASWNLLIERGWLVYERPVLWIVKGWKNDPFRAPNNPKQTAGVVAILKSLPKLKIVDDFAAYYKIPLNKEPKEDQKKRDKKNTLCSIEPCGKPGTVVIMGKSYCDDPNHREEAFK